VRGPLITSAQERVRSEQLLRPVALAACGYAAAAVVWLTFGDTLPGGRWFAVHLFTLGVLSNLIVALTEHFSRGLIGGPEPARRSRRFAALNAGALLILGFPPHLRLPLLLGSVVMAATVIWLAADLDRLRRRAIDRRFTFVAVGYELACTAFVVGAVLGALLGVQWVRGSWYGVVRLAHLHINVLGWGGLTLLTTVVFLGPRIMGTDMRPRAASHAVWALWATAMGLLVAVVALLIGPGPGEVWPRSLAAVGLAIYAAGAASVAWHVLRAGRTATASVEASMIRLACVWFVVIVTADAVAFGTDELRLLNALGAGLLVAVLGQAILAALSHLTPVVWGQHEDRPQMAKLLGTLGRSRVGALNLGAAAIVIVGAIGRDAGGLGAVAIRAGWALVAATVLAHIALIATAATHRVPGVR
jgi:hypothetical protein